MAGQISLIIHWSILPRCQSGKKAFSKDLRMQGFCTFIPPTKQHRKVFMKAHIWHKLTAFRFVQRIPHAASPSEHWDIQEKKYMMPFKRSQKKFVYKSVRNQLYILLRKLFPSDAASWTCGQKVGRMECTNQCIVTSRKSYRTSGFWNMPFWVRMPSAYPLWNSERMFSSPVWNGVLRLVLEKKENVTMS